MPEQWLRFLGINPPDVCPQNYGAEVPGKPHLIIDVGVGTGVEMDDISFSDIHATAKMFIFLTLDYKWVGQSRFRGTMENVRFTDPSALTDADKRFYMFDPEQPLGEKIQIDKTENVVVRDVKIQAASEF